MWGILFFGELAGYDSQSSWYLAAGLLLSLLGVLVLNCKRGQVRELTRLESYALPHPGCTHLIPACRATPGTCRKTTQRRAQDWLQLRAAATMVQGTTMAGVRCRRCLPLALDSYYESEWRLAACYFCQCSAPLASSGSSRLCPWPACNFIRPPKSTHRRHTLHAPLRPSTFRSDTIARRNTLQCRPIVRLPRLSSSHLVSHTSPRTTHLSHASHAHGLPYTSLYSLAAHLALQ